MDKCQCPGCERDADGNCRFCGKEFCEECWGYEEHGCWKAMSNGHSEEVHKDKGD